MRKKAARPAARRAARHPAPLPRRRPDMRRPRPAGPPERRYLCTVGRTAEAPPTTEREHNMPYRDCAMNARPRPPPRRPAAPLPPCRGSGEPRRPAGAAGRLIPKPRRWLSAPEQTGRLPPRRPLPRCPAAHPRCPGGAYGRGFCEAKALAFSAGAKRPHSSPLPPKRCLSARWQSGLLKNRPPRCPGGFQGAGYQGERPSGRPAASGMAQRIWNERVGGCGAPLPPRGKRRF